MSTLPYNTVVDAIISTTQSGASAIGFGVLNIITTSDVLSADERYREYTSMTAVAADFDSTTEAAKAAEIYFSQTIKPNSVMISFRDPANSVTEELDKIQDAAGASFYGFMFTKEINDSATDVLAAAAWSESHVKVFFNTTNDDSLATALTLKSKNYDRTITSYSSYPDEYISASPAARAFIVDFETPNACITLKFKKLPGITTESLTYSKYNELKDANVNFLSNVGGVSMYQEGVMASGTYFDERHAQDWLKDAIQVAAFNVLYTAGTKIPYTNAGVAKLVLAVRTVLNQAVSNGMAAPGYYTNALGEEEYLPFGFEINVEDVATQVASNRANRAYKGLSFVLLGAGAIHSVTISGFFDK